MTCGGFLELRSMGWEIKRNEPNRASEHQKRFIAMGLDGLAGWYMDGRAGVLYLSIYQMHTALVTAIRMLLHRTPVQSFECLKSPVLLIAPLCIN